MVSNSCHRALYKLFQRSTAQSLTRVLFGNTAPTNLTVWDWLFENPSTSPLHRFPPEKLAGYTNAITKERVNWAQVRECGTYVSTALVNKYGMKEGDSVCLFSQNTIWYPVAMYATARVGKYSRQAINSRALTRIC
jgi:hypothetical protein